ncbi:hypothetical protein TrRE_jg11134 [Triparma retinervis]|uniref:Uncharacterized protein n=1 Tax=Triparma retinervis TaxID=2557542 RepID=A0A9W6ZJ18_9STRA|nr:hypothetical protein TrRE_jg11134 [Triparma retinervis]
MKFLLPFYLSLVSTSAPLVRGALRGALPPVDDDAGSPGDACMTWVGPYNCTLVQHGDDLDCDYTPGPEAYDRGCCGCAFAGGCIPDNGQGCDCC